MTPALRLEIQKVLDRQGTSDLAFDSIACKILGEFDAQTAVVYTPDAGTGMFKLRCHCGLDRASADKIRFQCMGKGLAGKAASLREPVQAWQYPEALAAAEREVLTEGTLYVPMIADHSLRGVLGIAKEFRREFAPDEIAALSAVARLIAPYLK
jgi:signal transduction protein with GAF and PtsI domain